MRDCVNGPEFPGIAQAAMLDNDVMVAPARLWGKPTLYAGKLTGEIKTFRYDKGFELQKTPRGTALYKKDSKWVLLSISAKGAAQAFYITPNGEWRANLGNVKLQTASPVREWTTLGMKGSDTLLAGADGHVIEFARDGVNWKETRRWNSWGKNATAKFGASIWICADAGGLWVSDAERHRVLAFDLATGKPIAAFGAVDKPGSSLTELTDPQTIAARGQRAVVHDSRNQRLVKLTLSTD
jgi:hypothetical protein